jgi:hypothetical protein
METAKVDIRKLQLLNDRINQCLEALSQVRLTVHGLSHTSGQIPGQGLGFPSGVGGFGYPQAGIGVPQAAPFGQFGGPGVAYPPFAGLGHSSGIGPFQAFAQQPLPFAQPGFPFGQQASGPGQGIPQPWGGQNPWSGLSHTNPEFLSLADPFAALRIAQTFPYAQYPVPPIVPLY